MSDRALNRSTLARQLLLTRASIKPAAAVERLAGMQAQVARPPFIGLWTRIAPFSRADLVRAVMKREIVRGTMMRGTIHLMSRRDFRAFRPAIQPVLTKGMDRILGPKLKGLDLAVFVKTARAFFERDPCTFATLREHLGSRFPAVDERAMGYIVRMQLPLVQVPDGDERWAYPSAANFAVADSYLGERLEREAAAHDLALRYFEAFGPASIQDFQTWSGLTTGRAVVQELRPTLVTVSDVRGRELFDLPGARHDNEDEEAPVRFLPDYDNLLLAYADRSRIVADEHKRFLFTKNLTIPPSFLVDGRVGGLWRIEVKKGEARLVLKPFAPLRKPVKAALEEEGERLLQFVEPDASTYAVSFAALS